MPSRTKHRSIQVPAKLGRRTKYSSEWAERFCELLAQGQSVRQICSQPGQPDKSQVYRWLDENGDFRDQYTRAREAQADKYFQEIIEIADAATPETVNVARLRVDSRKFTVARLAPKKYGDHIRHDVKGAGGINFQPQILISCSSAGEDEGYI
jgi:hypothetical protein